MSLARADAACLTLLADSKLPRLWLVAATRACPCWGAFSASSAGQRSLTNVWGAATCSTLAGVTSSSQTRGLRWTSTQTRPSR